MQRLVSPLLGAAFATGACVLAAGCSGGTGVASSSAAGEAHGAAGVAAPAAPRAPANAPAAQATGAHLITLSRAGGQALIETAAVTLRARNAHAVAAHAAQLAVAAGGYVAGENAITSRGHPGRSTVSIQLKVPEPAYQATLAALARLGTTVSEHQQATDVTQAVADVASRVTSARAAIAQLRALLARAGSVNSLLSVQDQINAQEASLEELLAQQRALAHATTYATISLVVTSSPARAVTHHKKKPAGFAGGLGAGWRALRLVVSWLLTAAGAVLPFAVPVGLAVLGGYLIRRWREQRRAGPRPAD